MMFSGLPAILGISLGITVTLELLFAFTAGKREKKDLLLVCLVNVLTNPAVVLAYYMATSYLAWNTLLYKIPLETMAVLVEAYYYKSYGKSFRRPLLFSFFANLFSFGIGEIYNILGG